MNTFIDSNILSDFFKNQPQKIPFGNETENLKWNSFWNFLKKETDLYIDNSQKINNNHKIFFNALTTGRGETKIVATEKPFSGAYKNKIKSKSPYSFFCIDEVNEQEQKKYTSKNGYLIGFVNDYMEKWEKLSLQKGANISVTKNPSGKSLKSWNQLGDYLLPFTDVILIDNFIFSDQKLIGTNFEKILIELDKATPVIYNLTIVTLEGAPNKKIIGEDIFKQITDIKVRHKLKCKIGLVLTQYFEKEHDRVILTNYLRIKPGSSFNFFDSYGKMKASTKTDIQFYSIVNEVGRDSWRDTLHSVSDIINFYEKSKSREKLIFGNTKNALLDYKNEL